MRKSKLKSLLAMTIVSSILPLYPYFANSTEIDVPNEYFSETNINTWNQSEAYFNDYWADWFWFFFLWNLIDVRATLTHQWTSTTCHKQLRWYYTTNYTNFWMFPIDEETAEIQRNLIPWIKMKVEWGLYTECDIWEWVYWYIKWTYGWSAWTNQQEIRAWITQNKRQTNNSDLQLAISDFWKNIALSWYIYDSITKRSRIIPNFPERILINIPDEYFNNTMAISWNRNEMTFIGSGIDWFWLFFLGTWIRKSSLETPFSIKDMQWQELTCLWQINWYYSISLIDFGMFPLDYKTASDYSTTWIKYIWWWLYYDCKAWNRNLTWVFWHIKREYLNGYNSINTHEIRAWISSNWSWKTTSPIELIYPENSRNINRTLSWSYHSSLAKNSHVYSRFFWDAWFSFSWININQTWENNNEYIPIEYSQYKTNNILLYLKSTKQWATAKISLTWFDTNWQYVTWYTISNVPLENRRSPFNFYWYHERNLIKVPRMTSWIINIIIAYDGDTRSKDLKFRIENATPIINITKFPPNSCSKEITISATATNDAATFGYKIITWNSCTGVETGFNNYTWNIVLNEESYNNKMICFIAANDLATWYNSLVITWIDLVWPIISNNQASFTWYECWNTTGYVDMQDLWQCGNEWLEVNFNNAGFKTWFTINNSRVRFQHIESRDTVSTYSIPFIWKDKAGNQTTGQITMNWINVPVTWKDTKAYVEFRGNIMQWHINRKTETQASAWSCETITAEILSCERWWTGQIIWDEFNYQFKNASTTIGWYDICNLRLYDDDGSVDVKITWMKCSDYEACKPVIEPEIAWWTKFVDRCYSWGYKTGLGGFFTFENNVCSNIPETKPTNARVSKYTSGSAISVNINYQWTLNLKQYRASCIPNTSICTNITPWRDDIWCDDIYSWYFTTLRNCKRSNNKNSDWICWFKQNWDKCCKDRGVDFLNWTPHCKDNDEWFGIWSRFDNDDLKNCTKEKYCRRWCSDSPGSSYFEDVLWCTYTSNTMYWQCISSTSSFFSSNKYWEDSQWRCRRCGSNAPIVWTNNIQDTIDACKKDWAEYTSWSKVYTCDKMENARTERKDFPIDGSFQSILRDLENWSWCINESKLSPESPYQWQRSVWIQVKDSNNYISEKTESDLVIYDKEVTFGTRSPTLTGYSATQNVDRESINLNYSVEVSDKDLFYKIQLTSWEQSSTEQFVTNLFQTRIKPLVFYNISKEVTSLRFMKWVCNTFQQKTWIFNAPINNNCTCTGETCSWDYHNFPGKWLSGRIPAIDFGCRNDWLHRYNRSNVPVEIASGNKNMICTWLNGDKYSSCTEYSCDKYDGKNTIECTYRSCTNYWNWCLAYRNEIYTWNSYEDSSCTCIDTAQERILWLDPTNYDANRYRCSAFTWESWEPELECYECITYECIRTTNECQENAYSRGVTYFAINPRSGEYTSHLKLERYENIASWINNTTWWIIDLVLIGWESNTEYPITWYKWQIQWTNAKSWTNNTNININLSNVPRCIQENWEIKLKINTWLVSDFALNLTNSLKIWWINYVMPAQNSICCDCDLNDKNAACYVNCCDENDLKCYCRKHPNDHKCTCDTEKTGNLNCLCKWTDYEWYDKYYDPDNSLCKCDEPNPNTREYCTCSYTWPYSKNKVTTEDPNREYCLQSYCNNWNSCNWFDCQCNDTALFGPTKTGYQNFTLDLTTWKYRNSRWDCCVNCENDKNTYCTYHPDDPKCRCDNINYNCAWIKNNTVSWYIAVLTWNLRVGNIWPTNTWTLYLWTAAPICWEWWFTCQWNDSCPGFACSTWVDACVSFWALKSINGCETYYDYNIPFVLEWSEDDNGNPTRYERTWCKIKFDAWKNSSDYIIPIQTWEVIIVNFKLLTWMTAFMAWQTWSETYYKHTLIDAVSEYSWDNWFFFYISQPQWINLWAQHIQKMWVLWNITYEIGFSSWVADQYFYIWWTSIINWYKKELEIKKPTYNFANPKDYLFTFPEY